MSKKWEIGSAVSSSSHLSLSFIPAPNGKDSIIILNVFPKNESLVPLLNTSPMTSIKFKPDNNALDNFYNALMRGFIDLDNKENYSVTLKIGDDYTVTVLAYKFIKKFVALTAHNSKGTVTMDLGDLTENDVKKLFGKR